MWSNLSPHVVKFDHVTPQKSGGNEVIDVYRVVGQTSKFVNTISEEVVETRSTQAEAETERGRVRTECRKYYAAHP